MKKYGFFRVAAATPKLRLADCDWNANQHIEMIQQAQSQGCSLVVFPECSLTGYTCGDLFHQAALQDAAVKALKKIIETISRPDHFIFVVGLPLVINHKLYNVAAVCQPGKVLHIVTKTFLPNYKEFYDARYFASGSQLKVDLSYIFGELVSVSRNQVIKFGGRSSVRHGTGLNRIDGPTIGVEICEDLWTPVPPSSRQALAGAEILVNLSASNETVAKHEYRKQLIAQQSARCIAGYVYAGSGVGESTQDLVFGGHSLIAENGAILAESKRFSRDAHLTIADIDLEKLTHERIQTTSFYADEPHQFDIIDVLNESKEFEDDENEDISSKDLRRFVDPRPFVPSDPKTLNERCEEIFAIQVAGLARRLEHIGKPVVSIGVSGGLDSTLALLVLIKTADLIGLPRNKIRTLTMPGFGTTRKTLINAHALMKYFQTETSEIDIKTTCFEQIIALKHSPFGIPLENETTESLNEKLKQLPSEKRHDLVFENVQARARTSMLMNAGFTIGTGDMSELALGWCTYNADHMSMYNPNVSIPKTLIRFLVRWAADHEYEKGSEINQVLHAIANTVISPELLPTTASGEIAQATEDTVGPYELHDFFLYHFLRFGTRPEKILFLATHAEFSKPYLPGEIRRWLVVFLKRFFSQQFKRSCLPDGPKVGSVSLSPRGDWRMPSDAFAQEWLKRVE